MAGARRASTLQGLISYALEHQEPPFSWIAVYTSTYSSSRKPVIKCHILAFVYRILIPCSQRPDTTTRASLSNAREMVVSQKRGVELSWVERARIVFFHLHPLMGGKDIKNTAKLFNIKQSKNGMAEEECRYKAANGCRYACFLDDQQTSHSEMVSYCTISRRRAGTVTCEEGKSKEAVVFLRRRLIPCCCR